METETKLTPKGLSTSNFIFYTKSPYSQLVLQQKKNVCSKNTSAKAANSKAAPPKVSRTIIRCAWFHGLFLIFLLQKRDFVNDKHGNKSQDFAARQVLQVLTSFPGRSPEQTAQRHQAGGQSPETGLLQLVCTICSLGHGAETAWPSILQGLGGDEEERHMDAKHLKLWEPSASVE